MYNIVGVKLIPDSQDRDSVISSSIPRFIGNCFMMIVTIIMKQLSMNNIGGVKLIPDSQDKDSVISSSILKFFLSREHEQPTAA